MKKYQKHFPWSVGRTTQYAVAVDLARLLEREGKANVHVWHDPAFERFTVEWEE